MSTTKPTDRSTETKQQTLNGNATSAHEDVREGPNKGIGAILWRVGRDTDLEDAEAQLAEAHRRAVEQGIFEEAGE